jgi:hypothetical protein
MNILLAFAPFIAFVVVERIFGVPAGLMAGALASAALLGRDLLSRERAAKVLEIGTAILFGSLALYALAFDPAWSIAAVRLRVDAGLLAIVLVSIAIRRPFTLQYAREQVAAERWSNPLFVRTNYMISAAWGAAFAAMVVADILLVYVPQVPRAAGIAVTVVALMAAVKFTARYPERVAANAANAAA